LKTVAIGDTTLLSGIVLDLKTAYPTARLVMFTGGTNFEVARLLGGVDQVIKLPIYNLLAAVRAIRAEDFDLFLDFDSWPRLNALLTCLARAKYTLGFRSRGQYRHFVYDKAVPHSSTQHEMENYRDIIRAAGVAASHLPGFPSSVGQAPPSRYGLRLPYVVLHPWPSGFKSSMKEWPIDRWLALASRLAALDMTIALTGSPSERGRNDHVIQMAAMQGRDVRWHNCAGTTMDETIALLRASELVVSVNTGVMHIAAVLGSRVIGLHGPTSVARFGPLGKRAVAIRASSPRCGYLDLGFEYPRRCTCMQSITVDAVFEQCLRILDS
jgi:ADP-heptose:LPS heptosyltransferase